MNANTNRISIPAAGYSLSVFLIISYMLCVLFGLSLPESESSLHHELFELLPGFIWLTWTGFVAGLIWSVALAWYIALVFVPLYNFFAGKTK